MNRNEFLKTCGYACLSGIALATILQSCVNTKIITGQIQDSELLIDLKEFEIQKKGKLTYRKYIIAQNELLKFPISIYRFSDTEFTALYLQCTHQGAELQVFGDKLQCPAHGSVFSNKGVVENGPATSDLRTFPVQIDKNQLKINLK